MSLTFFTNYMALLCITVTVAAGTNFTERIIQNQAIIPNINDTNSYPLPSSHWPSIQVVIEDNNEIKLTSNLPNKQNIVRVHDSAIHQGLSQAESTPFSNFFTNFDFMKDFDSIDFDKNHHGVYHKNEFERSSNELFNQDNSNNNNNYHKQNDKTEQYIKAYESPPRYLTPKLVNPSFSKIPDEYLRPETLNSIEDQNYKNKQDNKIVKQNSNDYNSQQSYEYQSPKKPLVVPIGSRVHLIKYKDYRKPDHSEVISKFDYHKNEPYEPSVIELPSSQPVLPIVFNFKTKSTPIFQKTTQLNSSPNYQFVESKEPVQYRHQTVHKPVIHDLREIIVPYRFYVQEVAPVEDFRQTLIPVNANGQMNGHLLHNPPEPILQADLHNPYITAMAPSLPMTKVPVYAPTNEFNKALNTFDTNTFPASSFTTRTEHLVPLYSSANAPTKINMFNLMNLNPTNEFDTPTTTKNPYMDHLHPFTTFHHAPYRVSDLYQSKLHNQPFYAAVASQTTPTVTNTPTTTPPTTTTSTGSSTTTTTTTTFQNIKQPTYLNSLNHFNY